MSSSTLTSTLYPRGQSSRIQGEAAGAGAGAAGGGSATAALAQEEEDAGTSQQMYQDPDYAMMLTSEPDLRRVSRFDDFPLADPVLQGIYSHGFEQPSQVQQKGIMPILNGRDLICQFPSGSGKSGTFLIGMMGRIDWSNPALQGIVVAPTRELARQIYDVAVSLSRHIEGARLYLAIGGSTMIRKYETSRQEVVPAAHIVIGCPGRLIDFITRGHFRLDQLKVLCFDEADEMFSMGFREQVRSIIQMAAATAQLLLFSATIPEELVEMIREKNIMNNPVKILIKTDNVKLDGIKQYFVTVSDRQKYETLLELFRDLNISQAIIYCNSKERVEWLVSNLLAANFPIDCIYSSMTQEQRNEVIRKFRAGEVRLLIATDIIARGLDVQQVSVVINYDFPKDPETYIHRSGRSGRYGKKGLCINFVDRRDMIYMRTTQQQYHLNIEPLRADIVGLS